MSAGAWLRCQREALGLPLRTAATLLGTTVYKLQQMEMQDHPVPSEVKHRLALLHAETIKMLDHLTDEPDTTADEHPPIIVFRSNQALWTMYPHLRNKLPVQWFRVVAARAAAITGANIEYWTP